MASLLFMMRFSENSLPLLVIFNDNNEQALHLPILRFIYTLENRYQLNEIDTWQV